MIKETTPIELIDGLSEHTIKSLNRNQIFFVKDLFKYKDNFAEIKELPWIWENVIKELANIWLKNWEYLNYLYRKTKNEKDDELNLSPFFVYNEWNYYLNSLCYIVFSGKNSVSKRLRNYFKENYVTFFDLIGEKDFLSVRSLWKSCLDEITGVKYKIFDYYWIDNSKKLLKLYELYSSKKIPFKQIDSLNLKDYILNFYNNLSELEKSVVLNRENWFKNSSFKSLRELGENNNMKGERIRQYWVLINSDLDFYLQYYSHYFENYIENLLELHNDFEIRKFSEVEKFSQFSYEFISNILSKIISSNYLFHKNDLSNTFFFLKKSKIWRISDFRLFDVIDEIFYKERKIDKIVTLYYLSKLWLWENAEKQQVKQFESITKLYLESGFNLKTKGNEVIFPINKKDYPSLIMNELTLCNKRIHYSNLYNRLRKKYPQYSWNESTVLRVLQASSDTVNVWPWLYIHKSKRPNSQWFETIVEIIEKFLNESKVKCANIDDIISYVKKQKKVSDKSIKFYLMNNDKFIHIWEWIYWLANKREWKPTLQKSTNKSKNVIDIVENYLEGTQNKCANIDDIIKYVKEQKSISENYILTIVWDKQKNKNKFIRISTWIFWLTSYRGWKTMVNQPINETKKETETIVEVIEKFLKETKDKCATTDSIIKHVQSIRTASEISIKNYLSNKNNKKCKFIYIWEWKYWLDKYRKWKKVQWSETVAEMIEMFLKGKKDKCANVDDIKKYIKKQKKVTDRSILRYLSDSSRNKDKFIRIWIWVYWLANYREWKVTRHKSNKPKSSISTPGSILDLIEKYLEETENKCATTNDIIKDIQKQRTVSENSIKLRLSSKLYNRNNIIYIWEWQYWLTKYREWRPKIQPSNTTLKMIENYLEETENKCASINDIVKHVQIKKVVTENYIIACLRAKNVNKNIFINVWEWQYWLTKYREWKGKKSILDIINDYLEGTKDKCATFDDIIKYVKKEKVTNEHTIKRYLRDKKRNKNKFIRLWKWVYWLTKYREWKII